MTEIMSWVALILGAAALATAIIQHIQITNRNRRAYNQTRHR